MIGTAAAIGIGLTAAGTTGSFIQASKQRKKASEAEAAATDAMVAARKKLEENFYKGLSINKEPYQLEREAMISTGANAIQAGVESERGAGTVAGRVQMANNIGQRNIAGAMGEDILNLNKLVATEDQALNQQKINLDLGTAEGAQLAARNNEMLANQSLTQGIKGLTSLAQQGLAAAPLYQKDMVGGNLAQLEQNYNQQIQSGTLPDAYKGVNGQPLPFQSALQKLTGQQNLDPNSFQQHLLSQDKNYYNKLLKTGFAAPMQTPYQDNLNIYDSLTY